MPQILNQGDLKGGLESLEFNNSSFSHWPFKFHSAFFLFAEFSLVKDALVVINK